MPTETHSKRQPEFAILESLSLIALKLALQYVLSEYDDGYPRCIILAVVIEDITSPTNAGSASDPENRGSFSLVWPPTAYKQHACGA